MNAPAPPRLIRVGQIVPSSNTTMETEIPAMLRARENVADERFTFHSSRMRMKKVVKEELEAMDRESDRCAVELSDARVDVLGYACLVAIMSMGKGYHRVSQERLANVTELNGAPAPVVTSAGALVDALHTALGMKHVSVICPYMKPLTKLVVDYIESEGVVVKDYLALEIPDNLKVAAQDPPSCARSTSGWIAPASMRSCSPPAFRCSRSRRSTSSSARRASPRCPQPLRPRGGCSRRYGCPRTSPVAGLCSREGTERCQRH